MNFGVLRVTTPDGQTRDYPLDAPVAVIGRSPENSVAIDHISIARRHARLLIDSGNPYIEDLGSETGTSVAGGRLGPGGEKHTAEHPGIVEHQLAVPLHEDEVIVLGRGVGGRLDAQFAAHAEMKAQPAPRLGSGQASVSAEPLRSLASVRGERERQPVPRGLTASSWAVLRLGVQRPAEPPVPWA